MIQTENKRLAVYCWGHFCVDALCAYLLYACSAHPLLWIAGYHGIAFAFQPVIGILTDKYRQCRWGVISICLILCAYACRKYSVPAVILAAVGNALFHLEGGYVSLHRAGRNISPGGVFVSCGAIGIGIATVCGRYGTGSPLLFVCAFGLTSLCLLLLAPVSIQLRKKEGRFGIVKPAEYTAVLLFISVFIRGYAGFLVPTNEFSGSQKIMLTAFASFLGKFTGGFIADRFGIRKTAVISQLLAVLCPLCLFLPVSLLFIYLINIPMAVTLAALSDCFPKKTGFAFGLAPLGLYIGYICSQLFLTSQTVSVLLISCMMILSAVFLYSTLRSDKKRE